MSATERRYEDGSEPAVLDVLELTVDRHIPGRHQPENWLIDSSRRWRRAGRISLDDLDDLVDYPSTFWSNQSHSTDGINDRVHRTETVDTSLYLIRVEDLVIDVLDATTHTGGQRRRVKGEFTRAGTKYRLVVTDLDVEREYRMTLGRHQVGRAYLTISLAEAISDGYCYKLIAAVIPIRAN